MSHISSIDEPSKPSKHFLFQRSKIPFPSLNLSKFIYLSVCFCAFLSVCFFISGWKWGFRCPECDCSLIHASLQDLDDVGESKREDETTISHVLFGIGGSAETWSYRGQYSELWWKPNVTRGFVWMDNEPVGEGVDWPETSPPYRVSEDTARFRYTSWGSRSAVRIARIVKESFELGLDDVRWFVMGDDDSVFFPDNLVAVLNKYDHNQMYYIGDNSESVEQDLVHSYSMAYGGGGFAISHPLAVELTRILDGCIDRYAHLYGSDQKVGACAEELGVPLTKEHGFHQMDIRGSPYGVLSTHPLAPLVSLHHMDFLQPLFPGMNRLHAIKKLFQGYRRDPTRLLQHTFCYDLTRNWSISISWGYSVQLYPFLLTARDLNTPLQTFLTWRTWSQSPFTFETRNLALEPCARPLLFYLDGDEDSGNQGTTTWYRRTRAVRWKKCYMENYEAAYLVKGFNVSAEILDPNYFRNATRRQCSEITTGLEEGNDIVQLKIRDCYKGESASIPY